MTIPLDDARRRQLLTRLQRFYENELEEELTAFRAERLLDFFLETLGPQVYNQAVQDARSFLQERLDDMEGEVYRPEGT